MESTIGYRERMTTPLVFFRAWSTYSRGKNNNREGAAVLDVSNGYSSYRRVMRVIEFLESRGHRGAGCDKVQHFFAVSGSAFFLCDPFVEAADVPGQDAQAVGGFVLAEAVARVEGQEAVDIRPADQ
jgi:hypothetical protein